MPVEAALVIKYGMFIAFDVTIRSEALFYLHGKRVIPNV
jgi:hypothetical protein